MPSNPSISDAESIAKSYGLEAVPESVRRLGQLVSRPDATSDEIAKLIGQDKEFTARLLRSANPKAECEADYVCTTVKDALQRAGMGCVLLVAMHDPLVRAVLRTFRSLLGVELNRLKGTALPLEGEHVHCQIAFQGKATGIASLRLTATTASQIAARVLGLQDSDMNDQVIVDDVIGELTNIVVGNFKSNLCDAELNCKISPPTITRTSDFKLRCIPGSLAERIGFSAPDLEIFVDLNINPWGD